MLDVPYLDILLTRCILAGDRNYRTGFLACVVMSWNSSLWRHQNHRGQESVQSSKLWLNHNMAGRTCYFPLLVKLLVIWNEPTLAHAFSGATCVSAENHHHKMALVLLRESDHAVVTAVMQWLRVSVRHLGGLFDKTKAITLLSLEQFFSLGSIIPQRDY